MDALKSVWVRKIDDTLKRLQKRAYLQYSLAVIFGPRPKPPRNTVAESHAKDMI